MLVGGGGGRKTAAKICQMNAKDKTEGELVGLHPCEMCNSDRCLPRHDHGQSWIIDVRAADIDLQS